MKRKAIALTSALLLLGSTSAWAAPQEDVPLLTKYSFDKVKEYVDLHEARDAYEASGTRELSDDSETETYANIVVNEDVKVKGSNTQLSMTPFSAVLKGQIVSPKIYYTIFNAKETDTISFVVLDPDNKAVQSTDPIMVSNSDLTGVMSLSPIFFEKVGDYKIYLLLNGETRIQKTNIKSSLPK